MPASRKLDNPFYFVYIITVSLAVGLFIPPSPTAPSIDLQVLIATNDCVKEKALVTCLIPGLTDQYKSLGLNDC